LVSFDVMQSCVRGREGGRWGETDREVGREREGEGGRGREREGGRGREREGDPEGSESRQVRIVDLMCLYSDVFGWCEGGRSSRTNSSSRAKYG
jgi:hypothetical protein